MKKVVSLVMAVMLVFGTAACGSERNASETSQTTEKSATEEKVEVTSDDENVATKESSNAVDVNGDGKIVVGYITKNLTDPFFAPIIAYAQEKFPEMVDSGVIDEWTGILDGETDPNKQIDRADECLTKKCDIVVIFPAEYEASDPAVTKLTDQGIKVIVVNAKTASTDAVATAYCGSDDIYAGELMGQWMIASCPDGGKYIHCQGIIGNSAALQRGEGISNILNKNEKFECVGEIACEWSGDKAANAATDAINQYGDELVAIVCDNDDMSSAAQRACNNAGRSDIACVGVDGNQNPLKMIKNGEMGATVLQDGVGQIKAAVTVIEGLVNGQNVEKYPSIPFVLITKDNVDLYLK